MSLREEDRRLRRAFGVIVLFLLGLWLAVPPRVAPGEAPAQRSAQR